MVRFDQFDRGFDARFDQGFDQVDSAASPQTLRRRRSRSGAVGGVGGGAEGIADEEVFVSQVGAILVKRWADTGQTVV